MKSLGFLLLAAVNLIHCQRDDLIIASFQAVFGKLEGMSDRLKDVQQRLGNLERDFQGAAVNNQESLQRGLQEIKSFVQEEISRVISLSETDECSEGSHPCGSLGICTDALFSFTCSCPTGFTWDGSHCTDIDECNQGKAACKSNIATCSNTLGSYSCSCNPPFEGDGRTCSCPPGFVSNGDICEEFDCRSPAQVVKGLGCIKKVDEGKIFADMKDFCRGEGGRLLQHFNQDDLNDLWETFNALGLWVGVYDEKWTNDESLVPEDLWEEGYRSDPSWHCGILNWDYQSFSLKVIRTNCSDKRWGYCQL